MFNVIIYDNGQFRPYNIIPYFIREYDKLKKKPVTDKEIKEFIESEAKYQFWGKCEYETILLNWPNKSISWKWDVYDQIMMNIDIVVEVFKNEK